MGIGDKVKAEGEKSENTLVIWEKDVQSLKKFFSSSKKREERKRNCLDPKKFYLQRHTHKKAYSGKPTFFIKRKASNSDISHGLG